MATSELSVMLTAKGNLENELKSARDRVKDLSKEIRTIQASGGNVGEDLAREFREATRAAEKLGREVNDTNRKIKTAANQSSSAAAKIGRAWKKTAGVFSNNVVAGISAVSIALAGRAALNAYASAEKQQMQLNFAYEKFPALANASRSSFDSLNESLMNLTGADDDALAGAEAILARFQLTGKEIQGLIPLVNDYAIATGTELPAASETIGKAMMGNARALKALGIDFKSTGDRGKDLTLIMALLEDKVGGTGEAFGRTTAGQLAIAQKNFENLQEEIGLTLVPALQALISIVKPLVSWFTGLADPIKTAAVAIVAISTAALIATPRIIALKANMAMAGISASGMATRVKGAASALAGPWGMALAGATIALGMWISEQQRAESAAKAFSETLDVQSGALTDATYAQAAKRLGEVIGSGQEWAKIMEATGKSQQEFIDIVISGGKPLEDTVQQLRDLGSNGNALAWVLSSDARMFNAASLGVQQVHDELRDGKDSWVATTGLAEAAGVEIEDVGEEAETTTRKISALTRAVNRLSGASSRIAALRTFKKSVRDFIKEPSADAALSVVDSFNSAYSTFKDGSAAQARFASENYGKIRRTIEKSGLSKSAKEQLLQPLRSARAEADRVLTTLDLINGKDVSANVNITTAGNAPYYPIRRAAGGLVTGPGTATSDSIPALLSNGEYVLRAAAVRRLGMATLDKLNRSDRMTDPALLDRMGTPSTAGGPLIGSIVVNNPAQGMDVEQAVLRGMERAERIRRERSATRG